MLSYFKNSPLSVRQSVASLIYSVAVYKSSDRNDPNLLINNLESELKINFPDAIMNFTSEGINVCLAHLSTLSKEEKAKLLLIVVKAARESGNAGNKAEIVSNLFDRIGLTTSEQALIITGSDNSENNGGGAYRHAKEVFKLKMEENVLIKITELVRADKSSNSHSEGNAKMLTHLKNSVEYYKLSCLNDVERLGMDKNEIEQIFQEIYEGLAHLGKED